MTQNLEVYTPDPRNPPPQSTPNNQRVRIWSPPRPTNHGLKQKQQYKQWSDAETSILLEGYRNYGPNAKQLMKMFGESNAITEQQIRDKIKTLRLNGLLQ